MSKNETVELETPVKNVGLLDVNRGNEPLLPAIMNEIEEICRTGRFIGGDYCQQFENDVAKYCHAKHAIGCASGSDSLLISLMAIGIGQGDEVILPSFTFFATASAIWRLGAKPVFVDIEPDTFNIDPIEIRKAVTPQTKAIIPVHLFGQCADMTKIMEIANEHQLKVIEDAAQAIGARHNNQHACSIGDVGCLSFYPTKNLGGFGDGGMMTTNDDELAKRLRKFANHGMNQRYYHDEVGVNSRLDSIQAAALTIKLRHLPEWTNDRQSNAKFYQTKIAESGLLDGKIVLPFENPNDNHVWNQYTIRIKSMDRDSLREQMQQRGVGSEVYYPVPLHLQKCFVGLGCGAGSLPVTEQAASEVLSLPIYPEITADELQYVVSQLTEVMETGG